MNPPDDVFDAQGRVYPERRHHARRATDFDPELGEEIERGVARWARLMVIHRGKLLAAMGLVGAVVGYLTGFVGRLHDLDALTARVVRLEQATAAQGEDMKNIKASARLQNYILCVSVPRSAPDDARTLCQPIIDKGVTP